MTVPIILDDTRCFDRSQPGFEPVVSRIRKALNKLESKRMECPDLRQTGQSDSVVRVQELQPISQRLHGSFGEREYRNRVGRYLVGRHEVQNS